MTFAATRRPRPVTMLLFDGVNAIDVAGPLEAFGCVRHPDGAPAYRALTIGLAEGFVRSESGLRIGVDGPLDPGTQRGLLIVPGGRGIREPATLSGVAEWLRSHHHRFDRVASICTGAYALAEAGLLDGRRVATHWAHAADLARRYPKVSVDADALFLKEGRIVSSGGVTAGIDLALDLIEEDHGAKMAMAVARELVVYLRRTGSQAQFSEALKLQTPAAGALGDVCLWASNHLEDELTVEALAGRANLSPRQFTRRFVEVFGAPPGQYLRNLRLDAARTALTDDRASLEKVARASGFRSVDGFRRAFERRFGLCPGDYRQRFGRVIGERTC